MRWLVVLSLTFNACLEPVAAQQTLKLSATLTLEKDDDKVKTHEHVTSLLNHAKEKKLQANVVIFLQNMVGQLDKVLEAAKTLEAKKATEVPKDFSPAKYRVKAMPKLQTKKVTTKKMSAKDLKKKLQSGANLDFDAPMLVTNATSLFEDGTWDAVRRHWHAGRISGDEQLEKDFRVEYWPPDKARARMVGNMMYMEEPELVSFSRYLIICFHGTPAKPKLPGQNTEHCEQNVNARDMAPNSSELAPFSIFPEIKNVLPIQAEFKKRLLEAGSDELTAILGKGVKKWMKNTGRLDYQFFTFGPSGSGDKLHAENGLPFFDVLIHGSRRWLLLKEEEMERVAQKAREALEFDKTSAYMFFEEKLPELKEEFGLKKYVECNQNAGDLVIVPSGWFRVSLSLADSISYYETLLSEKRTLEIVTDNNVWRPQFRQYSLAFCYDADSLGKLPGVSGDPKFANWLSNALKEVKLDELINGILSTLFTCGSVLALDGVLPGLKAPVGVCSAAVWKQCRSQLEKKVAEKGVKVSLDWLPKEAVKSAEALAKPKAKASAEGEL